MEQGSQQNFNNDIHTLDADEVKLCEVAKHPFGLIILYLQVTLGVVLAVGLAYFLLPSVISNTDQAFLFANLFAVVVIILTAIIALVATMIYRQNRLIVTDRNITQILQYGLFSRKTSQLNLVNVEDVTSVQKGFFSTLFGFGDLKIETAGEQVNFHFNYCPRSGYYAKVILNAREKILGQQDTETSPSQPHRRDYSNTNQ